MSGIDRAAERLGLERKPMLGLVVLVAGALLWVLAFTGGINGLFAGSTTTLRANFASIEDIVPHDPVRVHGVEIGSVAGTSAGPGGHGATVTINLNSDAPAIYDNASAAIVWRTALGANDAIALNPGTRGAGLLGSKAIPQSRDSNQVELDQVLQGGLEGGAQPGLRTALPQIAEAFRLVPRVLINDFNTLTQIAPPANIGLGAVRGALPDTDLKNLVRQAGQAAQAVTVGTGSSTTRAFVQSAASTLTAVSINPTVLRESIDYAGVALAHTAFSTPRLNQTVQLLRPLVAKVRDVAPQVAPALASLTPAVTDLHTLLTDATPLLHKLDPTVHSLASAASVGVPVIRALNPSLVRLQNTILPGLAEKPPELGGQTTYQIIGPMFVNFGTLASLFDANGTLVNLTAGLSAVEPQSFNFLPCFLNFAGTDLLVCDSLSQSLGSVFGGGSTSLLQSLARRPGGAAIYGPLLANLERINSTLGGLKQKLQAAAPAVAAKLFGTVSHLLGHRSGR
jgi:ABC-type transporter Mla subunit MlaD